MKTLKLFGFTCYSLTSLLSIHLRCIFIHLVGIFEIRRLFVISITDSICERLLPGPPDTRSNVIANNYPFSAFLSATKSQMFFRKDSNLTLCLFFFFLSKIRPENDNDPKTWRIYVMCHMFSIYLPLPPRSN